MKDRCLHINYQATSDFVSNLIKRKKDPASYYLSDQNHNFDFEHNSPKPSKQLKGVFHSLNELEIVPNSSNEVQIHSKANSSTSMHEHDQPCFGENMISPESKQIAKKKSFDCCEFKLPIAAKEKPFVLDFLHDDRYSNTSVKTINKNIYPRSNSLPPMPVCKQNSANDELIERRYQSSNEITDVEPRVEVKKRFSFSRALQRSTIKIENTNACFGVVRKETGHEFENTSTSDEYVDIFTNDKNFIVRKDGWIDFADDEENKNIFRILFEKSRSITNLSINFRE